jgi:hypothetical protein
MTTGSEASGTGVIVRGLAGAVQLSVVAAALPVSLLRPIVMSRPLQPARAAADNAFQAAVTAVAAVVEERAPLIDGLVTTLADRYVAALSARPELVAALVERAAGNYLAYLEQHPELLDGLVRAVGDRYMDHLHENPQNVQELLAGQSASMATEIVEEVRTRSTAADNLLEGFVRGLLRKKPRSELAPPALSERPAAQRKVSPNGW